MKKTFATTAVVALVVVTAGAVTLARYQRMVIARFPDVDPKVARKAYKNMLKNSSNGTYGNIQDHDDAAMDVLFMQEVRKIDPSA